MRSGHLPMQGTPSLPGRRLPAFLCASLASTLTGCMLATQADVLQVQDQVAGLDAKVVTLQKTNADLAYKIDELNGSLTTLNENLRDSRDKMSQVGARMDDLQVRVGQSVQSLGDAVRKERQEARDAAVAAAKEAATGPAREAALKALEEASAKEAAAGPSPTKLYRDAYLHFVRKDYQLAGQGFSVYLDKYPKGELADLATYYLGESRYARKEWEDAAAQYAGVLDAFPKSDLVPSARLKYAYALLNLKTDTQEAKRYLESILQDYPHSSEAKAAKDKLASLDGKPSKSSAPPPSKSSPAKSPK